MKHLLIQIIFFLHWKNSMKLNNAVCVYIPTHSYC